VSPLFFGVPVAALMARLRDGDREALAFVYDALFLSLWRLAVLRTHAPDAAEDLVHEVFLAVWARRAELPLDLNIQAYFATAVRNRARAYRAHAHVERATETAVLDATLSPPGMGREATPADLALEEAELRAIYQRALATLTDREREAAVLRWESHWTIADIAAALELSVGGAHGLLARAQRKVQTALLEYRS